ncbi:MAG: T9SS type A sorting domain-containing protein, partial [Flavobacteriales bacterium]|nr:T9SS type A sorting domain-containing protein [Flavobacteriales bacterium]
NGAFEVVLPNITNNTTLEVLDLSGKIIFSEKLTQRKQRLNINNISRGIYLININQNGSFKTEKLIIK